MIRKFVWPFLFFWLLSHPASSQQTFSEAPLGNPAASPDFDKTVLKVADLKFKTLGTELYYGTAFCLDSDCQRVITNYHVAAMAHPHKIVGEEITKRYLATGPLDREAASLRLPSGSSVRFNYSRDLAMFELKQPLRDHHGAAFSLEPLQLGQPVDIYVFPLERILRDRKLRKFEGHYEGDTEFGLHAFQYELSDGHRIRPGSSGGIVVDRESQKIVGIFSAIADPLQPMVFAVPTQSLFDFISRVRPDLAQNVFTIEQPSAALDSDDLYPQPAPTPGDSFLHFRPSETPAVQLLRERAQLLADSMRNFIAVETLEWGSQGKRPAASAAYEIRVLGGYQRFRKYPEGTKDLESIPFPPLNTTIVPGGEWSELPQLIGTQLRLHVEQLPDAVVGGREIKIFRYRAVVEDNLCRWRSSLDLGFFSLNKDVTVGCYGEVWTDQDTNILRMSEHYELPGKWKDYQAVMTYGWLERRDDLRRLIPLSITSRAEYGGKVYWCRGEFVNYRVFSSQVRMAMN